MFVRDAKEKSFSRMLDIAASKDARARQSLVGPGEPVPGATDTTGSGRGACARACRRLHLRLIH